MKAFILILKQQVDRLKMENQTLQTTIDLLQRPKNITNRIISIKE